MKENIRKHLKSIRNSLSKEEVKNYSQAIISKIRQLDCYQKASTILIYKAINNEVDLSDLESDNKTFCYPLCINNKEMIALIPVAGFKTGMYGIQEPVSEGAKECTDIDFIICPLVGFDENGWRLGNGKGYYDRFLNNFGGKVLGVGYECQKTAEIPHEIHDQPMDAIVSEKTVYFPYKP